MNTRAGDRPSIPTAEKVLAIALVIVAATAIFAFMRAAVLVDAQSRTDCIARADSLATYYTGCDATE